MGINDSKTETWTVDELVRAVNDSESPRRVELPKFQRSVVWGENQRQMLIESIFRGYPIGSLLLYQKLGGNKDVYQVVDGLQRTSTLVKYLDAPLEYVAPEMLSDGYVDKFADIFGTSKDDTRSKVLEALRAVKKVTHANTLKVAELLGSSVGDSGSPHQILSLTAQLLDDLAQKNDLSSAKIPVVIYRGDVGELPEIFERANQQGTKLSKYEILASAWLESPTVVVDSEIRAAINNKYKVLIDKGFTIDGLTKEDTVPDINLFEYFFGLGKVLTDRFPILFKGSKGEDSDADAEPVGFSLATTVLGYPMSQLREMNDKMKKDDGWIDPTSMQKAIESACDFVAQAIKPYVGLKLNSKSGAPEIAHSEMQIVSMVARVAIGRWDPANGWGERQGWKGDWDQLALSLPQHYVADILGDHWRGPLYTYLYERVWDESKNPATHYAKAIQRGEFEQRFDLWFERQLAREQSRRPHVRASERLFLRCVYTGLVTHLHDNQVGFEIEHLFPVSRLVAIISETDDPGWPISCVANLALFTQSLNREKSAKTIGEYILDPGVDAGKQKMLDQYLLCEAESVKIADGFDLEAYKKFLRGRWLTLRTLALDNLKAS